MLGHAYPENKRSSAILGLPDMSSTLSLVNVGVGGPIRQRRAIWRQLMVSRMRP